MAHRGLLSGLWAVLGVLLVLMQPIAAQSGSARYCYLSDRGYQCMLQVCRDIAVHWSVGGPPPTTDCRYTAPSTSDGTMAAVAALNGSTAGAVVHMALVSTRAGFVAMSWPKDAGEMVPADAIAGFIQGSEATVSGFYIGGGGESQCPPDNGIVLSNAAVSDINGVTMCFTRTLDSKGRTGVPLSLTDQPLNFAGGGQRKLSEHSMYCAVGVSLTASTTTAAVRVGGNTGHDYGSGDQVGAATAHGWLMVVAWTLLVPLGVLMPRYRKVINDSAVARCLPAQPQPWFIAHMVFQWLSVLLFGVSLAVIIAGVGFEVEHWYGLLEAHGGIGITILVLLCLHLVLALLRPAPGGRFRKQWEVAHRWGARITVLLAFINTFIGPKLANQLYGSSMAALYVMIVIFLLLGVIAAVVLNIMNRRYQQTTLQLPDDSSTAHVALAGL